MGVGGLGALGLGGWGVGGLGGWGVGGLGVGGWGVGGLGGWGVGGWFSDSLKAQESPLPKTGRRLRPTASSMLLLRLERSACRWTGMQRLELSASCHRHWPARSWCPEHWAKWRPGRYHNSRCQGFLGFPTKGNVQKQL